MRPSFRPDGLRTQVKIINGQPDPERISTSYVERQNLTMGMRRFTRLANAFSKKVENHAAAISLHFMYMNFARPHKSLAKPYPRTPAMAAGLADHIWTCEEIAALLAARGLQNRVCRLVRGGNPAAPTDPSPRAAQNHVPGLVGSPERPPSADSTPVSGPPRGTGPLDRRQAPRTSPCMRICEEREPIHPIDGISRPLRQGPERADRDDRGAIRPDVAEPGPHDRAKGKRLAGHIRVTASMRPSERASS